MAAFIVGVLVLPAAAEQFTLTGHVYEGSSGDTSKPLGGVQVQVWGGTAEGYDTASYNRQASGTTDYSGYFSLTVSYDLEFPYPYYHLVVFAPSSYEYVSNRPINGDTLNKGWIRFKLPVASGSGGDFWLVRKGPPQADFTLSSISGKAPLPVTIQDTSTGNPTSWSWTFSGPIGAGTGPINQRYLPTYILGEPGIVTVTLTVSNAYGSNSKTKTITVSGDAPQADFTLSSTSGKAPLPVTIQDTSTGNPTSWSWTFSGPIGAGTGPINQRYLPTYILGEPGTVTVTLTVSNAYGSSSKTKTITVSGEGPHADFYASPTFGPAPLTVQFTDTSTGNPTSWSWDLNYDSTVENTIRNPVYTYSEPGIYSVSLKVTNAYNQADTEMKSSYITIVQPTVTTTTPTPTSFITTPVTPKNNGGTPDDFWKWILFGMVFAALLIGGYIISRPKVVKKPPEPPVQLPEQPECKTTPLTWETRGGIEPGGEVSDVIKMDVEIHGGIEPYEQKK